MQMEKAAGKCVLLGVTGSIAAYKAAEVASRLVKEGVEVHAIMTRCACEFIGPLTFQTLTRNPVTTSLFERPEEWQPGHISLADRANLLLIAPATANILAKLALGIADDPLSATALATRAPVLIAPAMNGKMWHHPATQQNVRTLRERGVEFLGPDSGMLACGYEGIGRLWPAEKIAEEVLLRLEREG
ncbi:MAG: phosphopantothenoylcysteine decarboxylase [Chthoniobacterales bacterium]|nr:phosphopantothenoylcysteine decarboxylase [Chthoniobacterales bacterium]